MFLNGKGLIQNLHETLANHKSPSRDVQVAVKGGIDSLADRVNTLKKANEIQFDKSLDPAMRPPARAYQYRTNAETAQKRFDAIAAGEKAAFADLPAFPQPDAAGAVTNAAMLQMLRGGKDVGERKKLLAKSSEMRLAAAIAPQILTGMTDTEHADLKMAVRAELYPEHVKQYRADVDALAAARDAVGMFRETSASLFRPRPITSIHDIPQATNPFVS